MRRLRRGNNDVIGIGDSDIVINSAAACCCCCLLLLLLLFCKLGVASRGTSLESRSRSRVRVLGPTTATERHSGGSILCFKMR